MDPVQQPTEEKAHEQNNSGQMKNYIIVALATALLVLGLVWIRDSGSNITGGTAVVGTPPITGLSAEGNYFKGDEDAPVTLYEFSDYQCPFCARFFSGTLPQIEEGYIKTGKVKLVFKDFPLDSLHPEATPAALAARCAGDQGKFWEFHDKIFENQQLLSSAAYSTWAQELGLDVSTFGNCFSTRKHLPAVRKDMLEGQQAGIQGTPGFVVDGQVISGAQPYPVFQQAIESALG